MHISGPVGRVMTELREKTWKNRGAIYVPKSRAIEYAEFAVSLYKGCDHGCIYCHAPAQLRMTRDKFGEVVVRDNVREGILSKLKKDAKFMKSLGWTDVRVLMSLVTDPYPMIDEDLEYTRLGIQILHEYGVNVALLSKSGVLAQRDLPLLTYKDQFATTLTCLNEQIAREWEPGAGTPMQRITNMKAAHQRGIPTWVSVEPVFDIKQAFSVIQVAMDYVDEFRIGKWNHDKRAHDINWKEFVDVTCSFLDRHGQPYVLKEDLKAAVGMTAQA